MTVKFAVTIPPLDELEEMPTLCVGQADDLKIEDGHVRVWLTRIPEDEGLVMIEVYSQDDRRWNVVQEFTHDYTERTVTEADND